ncbi:MAG: BBE domain-containing protein [Solirubrobacteraceae bacterium]
MPGETAFAERSMPYVLNAVAAWRDPSATEAHRTWARSVIEALAARKERYDPTNVFRRNHNIEPAS